jgi:CHAT domain-containing protein
MKPIILYIITFFLFNTANAQDEKKKLQTLMNKAYSFHYINRDSAYFYYTKVLELAKKNNDIDNVLTVYTSLIDVSNKNYDLKKYKDFLFQYEQFLKNDKRLNTYESKSRAFFENYLLLDKAIYYYKIKNYPIAQKQFESLHNKLKKYANEELQTNDIYFLTSTYSYLAIINKKTSKLDRASSIYEENLDFILQHKDSLSDWKSRLANTQKLLALVKTAKGSFEEANQLLLETQQFYLAKANNPQFRNNLLSSFVALAKNALNQKRYQSAIAYLDNSKNYYKYKENSFIMDFNLIYGDAYLGLKKYAQALSYYEDNLAFLKVKHIGKKHQDIARTNMKIAHLYELQNQFVVSLDFYQKALMQLDESFKSMQILDNPKPEKVSSKLLLLDILKEKLAVLLSVYKTNDTFSYLLAAQQVAYTLVATLDFLRPEFESKLDKRFLIEKAYPSIQKMLTVSYLLYDKTKEEKYIDDAFYFVEKSKSILLLEASRITEATKYGAVPKEILEKEQYYRAKITFYEHQIFKNNIDNGQKDSLTRIKNNYYSFIKTIDQNYPKYYDLKYNQYVVSANDIQHNLEQKQAIISYLVAENRLYAILIAKTNKVFFELPYSKKIQLKIKEIYQKSAQLNIEDNTIYHNSNEIYQAVLAPILKATKATKLVVFKDDLLNYIPYDALVTSVKTTTFLINKYTISYDNSATLWQEHQEKIQRKKKNKLLAFAPSFQTSYFNQLRHNKDEVVAIASLFKNKTFLDETASLAVFKKYSTSYNLLHLATHAVVNDANPDYSYLAFSNSSKNENLLYVKDLYNYQINADLVVLSACETGLGKLQKGEGMLSLARAFNYAGATALVTTLWKIDDESTSQIMIDFYQNLKKGLAKDEALRQAKLSYLNQNKTDAILRHPYYWSGVNLVGDARPITKKTTYQSYWLFILIVIPVLFFRKKLLQFLK